MQRSSVLVRDACFCPNSHILSIDVRTLCLLPNLLHRCSWVSALAPTQNPAYPEYRCESSSPSSVPPHCCSCFLPWLRLRILRILNIDVKALLLLPNLLHRCSCFLPWLQLRILRILSIDVKALLLLPCRCIAVLGFLPWLQLRILRILSIDVRTLCLLPNLLHRCSCFLPWLRLRILRILNIDVRILLLICKERSGQHRAGKYRGHIVLLREPHYFFVLAAGVEIHLGGADLCYLRDKGR